MNIKQEVEEKIKTDYRNGEFEEGMCQECGEALNNAEGEYCPKCLIARSGI